ncbi:MAG: hypothetical protein ACI955_001230 [Zhongshania sp.]|jgi:hypothetical protein
MRDMQIFSLMVVLLRAASKPTLIEIKVISQ